MALFQYVQSGEGRIGFLSEYHRLTLCFLFLDWTVVREEPKRTENLLILDFTDLSIWWGFNAEETGIGGLFSVFDTLFGRLDWCFVPLEEPWEYNGVTRLTVQRGQVSHTRPALFPIQRLLGLVKKGYRVHGWLGIIHDEATTYHRGEPDEIRLHEIAQHRRIPVPK